MTWFSKMAAVYATVILMGCTLDILGYTILECKEDCENQPDGHLCARKMYPLDNGGEAPDYIWLRNECERQCVSDGEYEKVDMGHCTKSGQNYTTYKCNLSKGHPKLFQQCMRNQSQSRQ